MSELVFQPLMDAFNSQPSARKSDPQGDRVREYAVLDTARDTTYDRLVFTAAQMFRVPIALIGLVDGDRLWFRAQVGLQLTEVPLTVAFCSEIADSAAMVVEDASADNRFATNPLVTGPPYLRFYAGAALVTPDGVRVGSLCIADRSPKTLLTRQITQLNQLAQTVVSTLELRRGI